MALQVMKSNLHQQRNRTRTPDPEKAPPKDIAKDGDKQALQRHDKDENMAWLVDPTFHGVYGPVRLGGRGGIAFVSGCWSYVNEIMDI